MLKVFTAFNSKITPQTNYKCSAGLVKWLLVAIGCCWVAVAAVANETSTVLGDFTLASFHGSVVLQTRDNDLLVEVIIENVATRGVPSEDIRVWLLLDDNRTAVLRDKQPVVGMPPVEIVDAQHSSAHLLFTYGKIERPLAAVLKVGKEFKVFPLPDRGIKDKKAGEPESSVDGEAVDRGDSTVKKTN